MKLLLNRLYEHEEVDIPIDDKLTIFIGNNGSGKTTILNMIYNVLNCNFKPFIELEFDKLTFVMEESDYTNNQVNLNPLIRSITLLRVENGEDFELYITYELTNQDSYRFKLYKHGLPFYEVDYIIETENVPDGSYVNGFNNGGFSDALERISKSYPDLDFNIWELKKSILYFPTYRRIDSDLLNLLEQNHNNRFEGDFENIKKLFDSLPTNNKIVGINNNDIDHIFKKYSSELQSVNTEGLNDVLKGIINQLLEGAYSYTNEKELNFSHVYQYRSQSKKETFSEAPEKLIQLANQLQLDNVNRESISEYFKMQERYNIHTPFSISNNTDSSDIKGPTTEDINRMMFSMNGNNDLILKLIDSYSNHLKYLDEFLRPYEYLSENFNNFFKQKIKLNMSSKNYKIELSKSFKEMSTGEKQILTILCYSALFKSNAYRPLIIIDEPELSLHMSWQMKLLPALLKLPNKARLIIATHSPYIAYDEYNDYIFAVGETDD